MCGFFQMPCIGDTEVVGKSSPDCGCRSFGNSTSKYNPCIRHRCTSFTAGQKLSIYTFSVGNYIFQSFFFLTLKCITLIVKPQFLVKIRNFTCISSVIFSDFQWEVDIYNWIILQYLKNDSLNSLLKYIIDMEKICSMFLYEMVLQIVHDKIFRTQQLFCK